MSEDTIMKQLNEMSMTVELPLNDWNILVNILNTPFQAHTVTMAKLIDILQMQISPQVDKARASLEAIKNADGVDKDLEAKN